MGARLIIIRYCCGKQCELLCIDFLHHKLDLLCNFRPPTSFTTPCRKKISTPPPRLSTPPPKEKFRPPTSFWTIRTLVSTTCIVVVVVVVVALVVVVMAAAAVVAEFLLQLLQL